jgi:predicted RNA-binding Zn-ribbon protein involved in translation (DUF1610 family)
MRRTAALKSTEDDNGDFVYIYEEGPPTPDKKLRLGAHHQGIIESEKELRRHKLVTGWKEPPTTKMKCQDCGATVPREHATQKFCKPCGVEHKRHNTKIRKRRQRLKEFQEKSHGRKED